MILFVDIDTQHDFLDPDGALHVAGAEAIIHNLGILTQHAAGRGLPILSSVDAHPAGDPEFVQFPPHCVKGTPGQEKVPATLLSHYLVLANQVEGPSLSGYQQVIVEKQTFSLFQNPQTEHVLREFAPSRAVVYGVATDYCVRAAVLGLLGRGIPVALVTDAIRAVNVDAGEAALREMAGQGAELETATGILARL